LVEAWFSRNVKLCELSKRNAQLRDDARVRDKAMTPLGLGLYTLADAARLIHAKSPALKRWLYGYAYTSKSGEQRVRRRADPLWAPQYLADDFSEKVIGFQDLLELRVVHEFVRRGVPLQVVRRCLEAAAQLFDADYPFTTRRFVTDGQTIYQEALRAGSDEPEVLDLRTHQYAFREIIKDSLYSGIEYHDGFARRWYPELRSRVVVIDPAIQFGRPVVEKSGVPTTSLYASYLDEGRDKLVVARLFEVTPKQVESAVRFEEKLLQAA
jgi:uncharacterized protein (DUF433 family)